MKRFWTLSAPAVGLVLAAGAAQAEIATADSGNSELVFTVWDPMREVSYALDLGTLLSDFQPSDFTDPGFTLIWAPDPLLTSFLAESGDNPLVWNVLGGDDKGGNRAGARALAFTADPALTEAQIEHLRTRTLNRALNAFDSYVGALNKLPTHNQDVNGDGYINILDNGSSVASGGDAYAGASSDPSMSMQQELDGSLALPGLGDSQNFWYVANGRSPHSLVDATAYGIVAAGEFLHSTFTFLDDGTLVFAVPVPEAEAWALLGLGLIGVGALARRRGRASAATAQPA